MRIESVTLRNFRCFGNEPTTVDLSDEVTAFIGAEQLDLDRKNIPNISCQTTNLNRAY